LLPEGLLVPFPAAGGGPWLSTNLELVEAWAPPLLENAGYTLPDLIRSVVPAGSQVALDLLKVAFGPLHLAPAVLAGRCLLLGGDDEDAPQKIPLPIGVKEGPWPLSAQVPAPFLRSLLLFPFAGVVEGLELVPGDRAESGPEFFGS